LPDVSSKKEARRRIDRVAKVMRQFGLSDPGDIADALSEPPFPSLGALEKQVKALDLRLPGNTSSRFVAEALLAAVNDVSPATLKWRERFGKAPDLASIKPGAKQAGRYHRTIFAALQGIFDRALSNGTIEQEINKGIHRVDIMFDNFADNGFFADVRDRLQLISNHVPTECKNYTDDLNSPEYDQLSGRLNKQIGQVGMLVFRNLTDNKKALEHMKAKWAKDELIIMLDDAEILAMHKARYEGRPGDVDALLWKKVRQLRLNSAK
jgi:hypothetical protein